GRGPGYVDLRVYRLGATPGTIVILIFDLEVTTAVHTGLQVFDASGRLTFDSNARPLRVLDSFSYNKPSNAFSDITTRNYPGKQVAIVQGRRYHEVHYNNAVTITNSYASATGSEIRVRTEYTFYEYHG